MRSNLSELPENLPIPKDDGKAKHLFGKEISNVTLMSSSGRELNLRELSKQKSVLFIYPRAGSPLEPNSNPKIWDSIPGARGCTPQSCGFRDLYQEFKILGVQVFGLSVQKPEVQKEFVKRNTIPFPILSDSKYEFTRSMNLPTFYFEGEELTKRMALVFENGKILNVFYPVFPPNRNAEEVLSWFKKHW